MLTNELQPVGREVRKSHCFRIHSGFYDRYCHGNGIELGAQGYIKNKKVQGITNRTMVMNLETEGYDGKKIPLADNIVDFVFSSHVLEHIEDWQEAFREWLRVTKIGGYIIIIVPHQFLYEKKRRLPSLYNSDHKRFYTPAGLLLEIESSLVPNSYRVIHMRDNDMYYEYDIPPEIHAVGCHEIELVLKKIETPEWKIS